MTAPTLLQLRAAWLSNPPAPATAAGIAELLSQRFHAYEIPVGTIPASDYAADEEVTPGDIWKLFTIDDPDVLRQILDSDQQEFFEEQARELSMDSEWPYILGNLNGALEPVEEVGFRLITVQVGRGERVSVVVEARDGIATWFKVYGPSTELINTLLAHVGLSSRSTAMGDIEDEDFALYLRHAYEEGLLKPPTP